MCNSAKQCKCYELFGSYNLDAIFDQEKTNHMELLWKKSMNPLFLLTPPNKKKVLVNGNKHCGHLHPIKIVQKKTKRTKMALLQVRTPRKMKW